MILYYIIFSCLTCALRSSASNTLILFIVFIRRIRNTPFRAWCYSNLVNENRIWTQACFLNLSTPSIIYHFLIYYLGFLMHAILLQDHMPNSSLCWILSDMDSETLELLLVCAPWSLVLVLLQIEW